MVRTYSKVFEITSSPECDGYQRKLVSMFYNFFDKKSKDTTTRTRTGTISEDIKTAFNNLLLEKDLTDL